MSKSLFLSSNVLSEIAYKAALGASGDPGQSLVAVLFTCAWLESTVNETLEHLDDDGWGPKLRRVTAIAKAAGLYDRWTSIERKLRVLGTAATGHAVDFGRSPFQEFGLLLDLRNWFVHWRPEVLTVVDQRMVSEETQRIVKRLGDVGVIPKHELKRVETLAEAARFPSLATWSYSTGYGILEELIRWFPNLRTPIAIHQRPLLEWWT